MSRTPNIEQVSSIKFLGLIVDNRLSWSSHIKTLTSTIAKATYQLARIKNFINADCRKTFYYAYIHSRLEYGLMLYGGAAANQLKPLKSLQKRATRLIAMTSLPCSGDVFKSLGILPLGSLVNLQRSILIFKPMHNKVTAHINALFTPSSCGNSRFKLPLPRVDIFKNQSVSFGAVIYWNSLPLSLRNSAAELSLRVFRAELKAHALSTV